MSSVSKNISRDRIVSPVTFEGTRSVCEVIIVLHSDSERRSVTTWRNSSGELDENSRFWNFGLGVDRGILLAVKVECFVRLDLQLKAGSWYGKLSSYERRLFVGRQCLRDVFSGILSLTLSLQNDSPGIECSSVSSNQTAQNLLVTIFEVLGALFQNY